MPHPLHWQSLDSAALEQAQLAKLRRYLARTVLPFSTYYGELFRKHGIEVDAIRCRDDLRRIPFSSKSDLLVDPKQFVLRPENKILAHRLDTLGRVLFQGRKAVTEGFEREFRPLMLTSTTGRSSETVPFVYTQHDIGVLEITGQRMMRVCQAHREMRMINMFPFAPHLAFWQAHYAGTAFGVFMVSSGGGKVMGTEGNLRLLKKINPDVLVAMPTFAYHVLRAALAEDVRCTNLSKIVLGGEKVPLGLRRKLCGLASDLGARKVDVLPTYGFTESKMAWPQCPCPLDAEPSGYHLYPDLGIFEVIDPDTGEPVGENEPGELVWTPLDSRGSVVLRYRTGDLIDGGLVHERCPHCGRNVPRLVGRISRRSEIREMRLDKLKGTLVDFNQLEHVLDDFEHIGAWQIELRKLNDDPLEMDELILHAQKLDGTPDARLRELLNSRFLAETEIQPNRIMFHDEAELRRMQGVGTMMKEQRLVDHRPNVATAAAVTTSPQKLQERPEELGASHV